jgi:hypothetical protein
VVIRNTISFTEKTYDRIRAAAEADRRSIGSEVVVLAEEALDEREIVAICTDYGTRRRDGNAVRLALVEQALRDLLAAVAPLVDDDIIQPHHDMFRIIDEDTPMADGTYPDGEKLHARLAEAYRRAREATGEV